MDGSGGFIPTGRPGPTKKAKLSHDQSRYESIFEGEKVSSGVLTKPSYHLETLFKRLEPPNIPVSRLSIDKNYARNSSNCGDGYPENTLECFARDGGVLLQCDTFSSKDDISNGSSGAHRQQPGLSLTTKADTISTKEKLQTASKVEVNQVIEKELRQIFETGLNKRMIEYTVYKKFVTWWTERNQSRSPTFYYDFKSVLCFKDPPAPSTSSFCNRLNNLPVFSSSASSESPDSSSSENDTESKNDNYSYGSSTASYHSDGSGDDKERTFSYELDDDILTGLSRAISSTPINQRSFDETLQSIPTERPLTRAISKTKQSHQAYTSTPLRLIQPSQIDAHQWRKCNGEQSQDSNATKEVSDVIPKKLAVPLYNKRSPEEELQILSRFIAQGLDQEDTDYLKSAFNQLVKNDTPETNFLRRVHWVDHYAIKLEPDVPKLRKHATGSARTEGFYRIDPKEKTTYLQKSMPNPVKTTKQTVAKKQSVSREARLNQRTMLATYKRCFEPESPNLKVNPLKFRSKLVKCAKSAIHNLGLFAMEPIAAGEMVIEYIGEIIRSRLADIRERKYNKHGIKQSYLFRIDADTVIDATKCGNIARFINHSCNPNCCGKVIENGPQKRIIVFAKRAISVNEEITYDYQFPIKSEKIPCFCGAQECRGTLN